MEARERKPQRRIKVSKKEISRRIKRRLELTDGKLGNE